MPIVPDLAYRAGRHGYHKVQLVLTNKSIIIMTKTNQGPTDFAGFASTLTAAQSHHHSSDRQDQIGLELPTTPQRRPTPPSITPFVQSSFARPGLVVRNHFFSASHCSHIEPEIRNVSQTQIGNWSLATH